MLTTRINDTPSEQKWILQGPLCGQWAVTLKERWERARSTRRGRKCAIDLEHVISVDSAGESVLMEMAAEGAVLHAGRANMQYVLES